MNSNLTRLDHLLYGWLAETDDRRFDSAFQRYYAVASSQLVSYLARRSSLPDLDCEQIAVDALLKFFNRVGRDRRHAAGVIGAALPGIQAVNLGIFHVRQVERWTADVGILHRASMSFIAREADADRPWKSEIQALTADIPPLQRQGCHLLEAARGAAAQDAVVFDAGVVSAVDTAVEGSDASPEYLAIRNFALALRDVAHSEATQSSAAESRLPGLMSFVDGTWSVIEALPLLRVPTNGYLFDMAQSLYLDECKARGRRKRGGSGYAAAAAGRDGQFEGTLDTPHPLLADDAEGMDESTAGAAWHASAAEIGIDPTADQIDEEFCERFYAHLRRPLEETEEAYHEASMKGRADAERKRLDSVSKKSDRLMSVLALRIEGQTQEAIAETLSISRNQVKYIVEQVQAFYQEFCAAASKPRTA